MCGLYYLSTYYNCNTSSKQEYDNIEESHKQTNKE